MLTAAH